MSPKLGQAEPIAAKRMRVVAFGGGALSWAEALREPAAAHATPAAVVADLRNSRRPGRSFFIGFLPVSG